MSENKYYNALRFYLLATKLKNKIRSGWDERHWNIDSERIESVAEHVYGTCILAISLDSELDLKVNINKVLKMLVIHEIGEVLIGDITPFDNVTREQKRKIERKAVIEVIGDLFKREELISLMDEFDEHETEESKLAYYCDKLDADIQSKIYQDNGNHRPLSGQENNVVFRNKKVQQMIEDGAQTPFDIWYEWDKEIYQDNKDLSNILKYVKETDTRI